MQMVNCKHVPVQGNENDWDTLKWKTYNMSLLCDTHSVLIFLCWGITFYLYCGRPESLFSLWKERKINSIKHHQLWQHVPYSNITFYKTLLDRNVLLWRHLKVLAKLNTVQLTSFDGSSYGGERSLAERVQDRKHIYYWGVEHILTPKSLEPLRWLTSQRFSFS